MALSAATHRTQDVAFNSFRQETSPEPEPEEEVAEERSGDGDQDGEEEKEAGADAAPKEEDHDKDAPSSSRRGSDISEVEEARAPTSASGKFTLGIEDGSEFLDELSFSLQHCRDQEAAAAGAAVEGQPPPGHWVSQPHGE